MDRLWTPWRFEYVTGATRVAGCLLCAAVEGEPSADETNLVLHRGTSNFVIVNKYPYSSGHLMVAPFVHVAELTGSSDEQLAEMMTLARACESILTAAYTPDGFNIGMNLGKAAGAGVVDHQHLHVVPRWIGDASFMTTTADTRVVPESPAETFARLRPAFDELNA